MTTALQQIVEGEEQAQEIIEKLEGLEPDEDIGYQKQWEFSLVIEEEDIPHIIGELKSISDDN